MTWGVDWEFDAMDGFPSRRAAMKYARECVVKDGLEIASVMHPDGGCNVFAVYRIKSGEVRSTSHHGTVRRMQRHYFPNFHAEAGK